MILLLFTYEEIIFREIESFCDLNYFGRPSTQNIEAVRESVVVNPGTSIWHRDGQDLDIPKSSLQDILARDLKFHTYTRFN